MKSYVEFINESTKTTMEWDVSNSNPPLTKFTELPSTLEKLCVVIIN